MEFTTTSPQAVISNAQITTHDLDLQDRHISIEVCPNLKRLWSGYRSRFGDGMRAIHIDDVHMLARFAAQNDDAACFDVLTQAHIADKYRKKFLRTHPRFGMGSISSTLCHMSAPLAGLTWISEPETLAAFERALGVIARFKSELHHMNTQRRDL